MDGDGRDIEGYRGGNYHELHRHTGSLLDGTGAQVYELGRRLTALAGLRCFDESQ